MVEGPTGGSATQETVADTDAPGAAAQDRALERGETVGRYVILEKIGSGGMGVVYAAYDPELDRKVALKRLRAERSGSSSRSDGRSRLLREAQAMARLSHPNVVAVHDVGVHDERVFLAMEYVDGTTLGALTRKETRPWREVLPVFQAAGRGLAAAHAAGLVHRDFKPDNVLMRDDGTVKVTDFGLARDEAAAASGNRFPVRVTEAVPGLSGDETQVEEVSLTRTGAILGTPAYMSPEQHLGLPTDHRTDQFSFCVALYEALFGVRPFRGETRAAVAVAVTEGRVDDPPAGTRVPGWVRQVVLRGLAASPGDRFPSMTELLDALAADPGVRRRRWLGYAGAGALVAAGALGLSGLQKEQARLCANMEHHLGGVWDGSRRQEVEDALARSGVGFAASTSARVTAGLDAYAESWTRQRTDACEATQIRGDQSQTLMDLRMECLDARLRAMSSVVEVLAGADQTAAQNAVAAVANLPDLARCANATALLAEVAPPEPGIADTVAGLRDTLARARAHEAAGQYETGLGLAREAVDRARAAGYAPALAEALFRRGSLEHETGADAQAEASLEEAYFLAIEHRLDDRAARAAAELVVLVGESQVRPEEGRRWAAHARAHAEAVDDPLLRASAMASLAAVAHKQSKFDEAWELATEALEIRSRELGERHEARLGLLNRLGLIASDTGKFDEARDRFNAGLELGRDVLGPDHPDLGRFLNNLAKISWSQGKMDEAEKAFSEALDLQAAALGPDHRNVAQLHNNLAAVAASRGDMEEAGRRFALALGIWEKALGPEHPSVADGLNNLAVVSSARGRFEEARGYDERALAIREKTMEPDHPALAQNYNNLGEDFMNLGQLDRALELHRKALDIYERKLGPDHDDVALALTAIGHDLVLLDRPDEAVPLLERALDIRARLELDEVERAHTRWALARALWNASRGGGRDRPRARELAGDAMAAYEAAGDATEGPRVRAWLASHGGR